MSTIHGHAGQDWAVGALPIIDAHHHLWDLSLGHYPWLQDAYEGEAFFLGPYASFCHDFLPVHYRELSRRYRVLATVHIEAERDRAQAVDETAWLETLHAQDGFPNALVAYADFNADDIDAQLARQAASRLVRGIRCKPVTRPGPGSAGTHPAPPGGMQDPRWRAGLALLEKYGLSWDLRVPWWHLEQAAELARDFPRIAMALNHTGLPWDRSNTGLSAWRRGLERLADNPNVSIKLSEFGVRDRPFDAAQVTRIVRDAVAIFGPRRCMFASNFPVSSVKVRYDTLVDTVVAALAGRARGEVEDIMAWNAARFYRIQAWPGPAPA